MHPIETIDKMEQELRFIGALFFLISLVAEEGPDAVSDVCHYMTRHVEALNKFVNTELTNAVRGNQSNKKKKAA